MSRNLNSVNFIIWQIGRSQLLIWQIGLFPMKQLSRELSGTSIPTHTRPRAPYENEAPARWALRCAAGGRGRGVEGTISLGLFCGCSLGHILCCHCGSQGMCPASLTPVHFLCSAFLGSRLLPAMAQVLLVLIVWRSWAASQNSFVSRWWMGVYCFEGDSCCVH